MKKIVYIILLLLTCCKTTGLVKEINTEITELKSEKIDTLTTYQENGAKNMEVLLINDKKEGNGYMYSVHNEIIGFKHFENDTLNGFGLSLYNDTKKPKYIFQYNQGKMNGTIISFYKNGSIERFRSSDIYSVSQKLKFHENGVIKSIGQTQKGGNAFGTWLFFNEKGILERTVEYENGEPKK
ncbi:toxin-antitoxin system YwqK family antitoxin [Maribacter arcticus]|uniref:MORN repeat variant n=1 Tax=Maribacter arcticus TaxID=561365 RepID=A0A1T5D1U4_9FLAO|nr:hypothetical protein [Maribacter arcticus]SKB65470.1 hypothetical protein SAMN05660866_02595 [Maribacter arcticus]